jgi:hypothetical protein
MKIDPEFPEFQLNALEADNKKLRADLEAARREGAKEATRWRKWPDEVPSEGAWIECPLFSEEAGARRFFILKFSNANLWANLDYVFWRPCDPLPPKPIEVTK